MKVSRDLDKPRRYTLGPDTQPVHGRPGEELTYNAKERRYEVKSVVGGGRSAGVGGPTAAQMAPKPKPKPKPAPTPMDIDQLSALPPEKRRPYEKKAEKQTLRDYPPAKKAAPKPPAKK